MLWVIVLRFLLGHHLLTLELSVGVDLVVAYQMVFLFGFFFLFQHGAAIYAQIVQDLAVTNF